MKLGGEGHSMRLVPRVEPPLAPTSLMDRANCKVCPALIAALAADGHAAVQVLPALASAASWANGGKNSVAFRARHGLMVALEDRGHALRDGVRVVCGSEPISF